MNPDSQAAIAYRNIARRILGDTVPLMQLDQKKSVMTRFKKFLVWVDEENRKLWLVNCFHTSYVIFHWF